MGRHRVRPEAPPGLGWGSRLSLCHQISPCMVACSRKASCCGLHETQCPHALGVRLGPNQGPAISFFQRILTSPQCLACTAWWMAVPFHWMGSLSLSLGRAGEELRVPSSCLELLSRCVALALKAGQEPSRCRPGAGRLLCK